MVPASNPSSSDRCHPEALTSIHHTYTLAATDEAENYNLDKVIVKHFEETIAEIALAIASRKENNRE
jgi:hypothetical protein